MTDLEKYELVNRCESVEELENAIKSFADEDGMIQGRDKKFNAGKMAGFVHHVVFGNISANVLTREFGIRQQALYLSYYND